MPRLPFPLSLLFPFAAWGKAAPQQPVLMRHYVNYALMFPRFWRWYFRILCVLVGLVNFAVVGRALMPGGVSGIVALSGLVLSVLALWPLRGYAHQRKTSPRWLAQFLFFPAGVLGTMSVIAVGRALWLGQARETLILLIFSALVFPYLFALHQYVFRSLHLWLAPAKAEPAAPPVAPAPVVDSEPTRAN